MKNLFILALMILAGCGKTFNNERTTPLKSSILNGTAVTADNQLAKSVVSIFAYTNKVWFNKCTASVLSDRLIVTAAHCIKGKSPRDLLVNFSLAALPFEIQQRYLFDEFNIKMRYDIRNVKSFKIHPKYSVTENDIAILLLDEKAPATAVPVKLLPEEYLNRAEQKTIFENETFKATLLGVGVTDMVEMKEAHEMREVTVPAYFKNNLLITDQRDGRGACLGDSGGPAFIEINSETYLVGVTHGPHGNVKTCNGEGEFTNPIFFLDFIESAIRDFQKLR